MSGEKGQRKTGKRPGRKPVKIDVKAKLERSRQSARECRARKKLRYQYIEELVANREKAVFALREELQTYKDWCEQVDSGFICEELKKIVLDEKQEDLKKQQYYTACSSGRDENVTRPHEDEYSQAQYTSEPGLMQVSQSNLPKQQTGGQNVNGVNIFQGMNIGATNEPLQGASYMPNRPPPSVKLLSEQEQIRSWYLFLKDDEERFSRDGSSGPSTPKPTESVASASGVPSVVTDYLDMSSSSDSSYS